MQLICRTKTFHAMLLSDSPARHDLVSGVYMQTNCFHRTQAQARMRPSSRGLQGKSSAENASATPSQPREIRKKTSYA